MAIDIEKGLADAGYRMFGLDESKEDLILSILNAENMRYLKAIPFLIYSYHLDLERIYAKTKKKKLFAQIIAITRRIFSEEGISKQLPAIDETINFDYSDFKQEFEMQRLSLEKPNLMIEKQKIYAERDLQMWLSQIFTKKEKQIIKRILEDKPVSRTDYEYYSRKTRKKLNSITSLYDFAMALSTKSPKYDGDLFKLKKMLEKELGSNISIQKFFYSDGTISISYQKKSQKGQLLNAALSLKDIKKIPAKELIPLLEKYKSHDFS